MLKSIALRKQFFNMLSRLYNTALLPQNILPNTIRRYENKTLDIIVLRQVLGNSLDAQMSEINPASSVLAGDPKLYGSSKGIQADVLEKWSLPPKETRSKWFQPYVYML